MYKRVLLPLDGSPLAEQALPHAIAQARNSQAELVLLRVVEPFDRGTGLSLAAHERLNEQAAIWAREYLEPIAADVQQQGIRVQVVIVEGRPHVQIAEFAEGNQVDLIVISARGKSGLSRWLMGSVADRIVRGATVPVLLVRALKEEA